MFVVGARLGMPVVAVVLRKAYGMGTMAMAASGLHAPLATAAWPSGEFEALGARGRVDPGDTRDWLVRVLAAAPAPAASCRFIDPW